MGYIGHFSIGVASIEIWGEGDIKILLIAFSRLFFEKQY